MPRRAKDVAAQRQMDTAFKALDGVGSTDAENATQASSTDTAETAAAPEPQTQTKKPAASRPLIRLSLSGNMPLADLLEERAEEINAMMGTQKTTAGDVLRELIKNNQNDIAKLMGKTLKGQ